MRWASLWKVLRRKMSPNKQRDQPKTGMRAVVISATKPTRFQGFNIEPSSIPTSQSMREQWFVITSDDSLPDMLCMSSNSDV